MQTRAAVRKLFEATAADNAPVTSAEPLESSSLHTVDDDGDESKVAAGQKRKRSSKKQTQPLKGGWVLPHGMGVAVAGTGAFSSQEAEPTPPVSSPQDLSLATSDASQSGLPTAIPKPARKVTAPKKTKQTRISLRVTKVGFTAHKDEQKKEDPMVKSEEPIAELKQPIVKLEGSEDSINPSIKQEKGRPTKRVRTEKASDTTITDKNTLELAQVKIEKKQTESQPTPKLLIFKGIIIRDNAAAKTLDKIIVDASQLLDPNFRRIVKRGKENPYGLTPGFSPYPYRRVPTPEACEEVHAILTELHGEVKQPEKMPAASLEIAGCGEVPCVLDALLRTLISGNTLMALADAAVKNLAQHYGVRTEGAGAGSINWDKVRLSSHQELVQVIKVAGNGPKRSSHIKQILDMVYQENLERAKEQPAAAAVDGNPEAAETRKASQDLLSLDYMHSMSKDEAMAKFVSYPGIGVKTAACVTLFCLRMPCFAVDTHVHKFCRWLGWVPEKADPDNCFRHGDFMIPDHLKYGLHQLFIRHGQMCFKCRKATKPGTKEWEKADSCPLEHLLDRSKDEAGPKKPKKPKKPADDDTSSDAEGSESEGDDVEEE